MGVRLEFSKHQQSFKIYTIRTVASSTFYSTPFLQLFTFTSLINISVGDFVCVDIRQSLLNATSGSAFNSSFLPPI